MATPAKRRGIAQESAVTGTDTARGVVDTAIGDGAPDDV